MDHLFINMETKRSLHSRPECHQIEIDPFRDRRSLKTVPGMTDGGIASLVNFKSGLVTFLLEQKPHTAHALTIVANVPPAPGVPIRVATAYTIGLTCTAADHILGTYCLKFGVDRGTVRVNSLHRDPSIATNTMVDSFGAINHLRAA